MVTVTYQGHENGQRDFGEEPETGYKYAKFYRVSFDWLMVGIGEPHAGGNVQKIYDEIPPPLQPHALRYLNILRSSGT